MTVILIVATLLSLVAIAGIIYPFKPFRKRRNALFTLVACVVAVGMAAPDPETGASRDATAQTVEQISVPSDPKARYFVTKIDAHAAGMIEISTRREGPSGTSFAIRQVKCEPLRFAYIAEGDSETNLVRDSTPVFSKLVDGSISDVVARYACAKRLVDDLIVAERVVTDPIPNTASSIQAAEERAARRRNLEGETRDAVEASNWGPAAANFLRLLGEGLATPEFRDEIEARMLELVKPIPSRERKKNLLGYELLAAVRPGNLEYEAKVHSYEKSIAEDKARELAALEESRKRAVSILRKKEDRVEGVTFYQHPNTPKYLNSRSTVYLYIGRKGDGKPWLRMKVQYTADDWLFVKDVAAWHDGVKEQLVSGRFETDHNSDIWEWVDVTPSSYQIAVLRSLADSKEAILRFTGGKYRRDVKFSAGDKRAIREVLMAYEVLRNEAQ
jgi:hypothetical protein